MTKKAISRQWWVEEARNDYETKVFAVTAGLGSGKTHGAVDWHDDRTRLNSESPFSAFVMPIYQKIHDAAIPTFRKYLASIGWIEGGEYEIVKSPFPKLVYKKTGQETHFLSANRPDRIVAVEYSHATISEAGSIDEEAYRLIRSRCRCSKAVVRQQMLEGVPQGLNYYADQFDSDTSAGWIERGIRDYIHKQRRYRRFRLTTYDNPFVPDDYASELLEVFQGNTNKIRSYIFGEFTAFTEGNCYNYLPQIHDIEDIDPDPFRDIDLTFDFNTNGRLAWISNQCVPFVEYGERLIRYVAIHEANQGFSHLKDVCVEFAAKHPARTFSNTVIKIYGDRSGYSGSHRSRDNDYDLVYKYLRELGYNKVEICALRYNPLETISVEALNNWFTKDKHRICKRCHKYRRSLASTSWKENTRKIDKPQNDDWTDHSDAQKYYAYAEQENELKRVYSTNF